MGKTRASYYTCFKMRKTGCQLSDSISSTQFYYPHIQKNGQGLYLAAAYDADEIGYIFKSVQVV
jgi:hypothetical protein